MQNYEDELTTLNYEEDYEPILPDGWSEKDDFFADPASWSGSAQQTGQSEEPQSEQDPGMVETETEEALTTGDTEETGGQSAEEETEDPASGQTEEAAKTSRILKLKVNHEDQEVDINSMSDDELIAALQKSRAFDAIKDEQAKARFRQVYQDQIDAGMTDVVARMAAANACDGKTYALEDQTEQEATPTPAPTSPPSRDLAREVQQLKTLFADFKEMPDEVALAHSQGVDLVTAYVAYRSRQSDKAAASLKRENEVLKQNAASAAKAPVKGVTGGGATNTKPKNNLLVGFDSDDW